MSWLRQATATNDGFSLVEMLLVLLILALVSSLFVPNFRGARDKTPEELATRLQATFLQARTNAISRGVVEAVQFHMTARKVAYSGRSVLDISPGLSIRLRIGRELLAADGDATLLFLPDGGSSGADITFTGGRGVVAGVAVSWLTGLPTRLRDADNGK